MLVEIWSPAFKTGSADREPIRFRRGLNVIKGADDGTNSIGKSSLLLAIDFTFGGGTYVRSEAPREVGPHTVYWMMEFDGDRLYFGRNTAKPSEVIVCTSEYEHTQETLQLNDYGKLLATRYGLDLDIITWQQLRTSFFRIYGKNNFDETNPLKGWPAENKEQALRTLLDLFGFYRTLATYDQRRIDTKAQLQAFKAAQQYKFLPETSGGIEAIERQRERITLLESKREEAIAQSSQPVSSDQVANEQERLGLRREINRIDKELNTFERRLHLVRMTEKYGVKFNEGDILALQRLFPALDIRSLHEIERFHAQLAELLESTAAQQRLELERQRDELVHKRSTLKAQLNDLGTGPGYSREFLDYLREIDQELGELRTRTDTYELYQQLERAKQQASSDYNKAVEQSLTQIEAMVNRAMQEISERVMGVEYNPPTLIINGYNSYTFETPHDGGTGTGCRGLTIYDFAILKMSNLPAIAHDTNILKQCDDSAVEGIMEEYGSSKKQIFLAFDRSDRYTPRVNEIVNEHTVIQLGADIDALFGKSWNRGSS